ncbi:MFS transporter PAT family beta-lactamase induction signal transducer ampG [Fasciola gigantica]|uniref:MFS transporter PAT family beta-lactamase induction signal transducer ampG n=1 Tax=Fasciola gigantica TaxID=46835 RepID=A0A504Z1F8_FASGI|nr:MFS transporter PAT family beta-lactamase induction signal transducer ampG [Fasciola gigantica]
MSWTLLMLLFLYVLEGIPYGLQSRFLPLVLRSQGLSLTALGFYKLLYIPWLFKSFYAPLVDTCLTKRLWLLISLMGLLSISVTFSTTQIVPQSSGGGINKVSALPLACCLFFYNLCAATQDIAVDGLALLVLSFKQLSAGNTVQVVGYKLGAVLGGGVFTSLASYVPFPRIFWMVSAIYALGVILCFSSKTLLSVENHSGQVQEVYLAKEKNTSSTPKGDDQEGHSASKETQMVSYFQALRASVAESPGSKGLCVLLLIYKLGEQGAMNMLPLLLFDRGASLAKVGFWTGLLGQFTSVSGSTVGYRFLNRGQSTVDALFRLLVVRALFQSPLVFIANHQFGATNPDLCFALGVLCMNVTLFVSGAITTVMFTLMMQCTRVESDTRTQATHYTILSTAELLGKLSFGLVAAPLTDWIGYASANVFFLTLSALPVWFIRIARMRLTFVDQRHSRFHAQQK